MILSDHEIKEYVKKYNMIDPFDETRISKSNKIHSGLSSYGYDIQLDREFFILETLEPSNVIDPKEFDITKFKKVYSDWCIIPAKSYVLAKSVEYFRIPRDILVITTGKSTYARCGLIVNITPLEPEWEGVITISLINPLNCGIKVYAGEGIAQLIFLKSSSLCKISYKDKSGKYQAQKGITLPKV